ncbi:beta-glucuronidase-like isoform X2 [Daphnia carinata]|uniref:beta-glucuronidase-like isoform X2 n=1 Tax=Daphnia carinata TaxID=120202 RepID=UPI00257C90EB|nr:beta-glucuronidase-like isoform X2 [Daphnia carinata]
MHWRIFLATVIYVNGIHASGILYPRPSESRETLTLDGIWKFAIANRTEQDKGFKEKWYAVPLHHNVEVIDMPVPSSYNDVTQDPKIRDHIGWAWYQREFFLPKSWKSQRVTIRFGSVNYYAVVWINGVEVTNHSGGYLPFTVKITDYLKFGHLNWITVAVNNTLTPWTIPQGKIVYHNDSQRYPAGYYEQQYNFDFFNFAGIHRPVVLSATPKTYIDDITINTTSVTDSLGVIFYSVELGGPKIAAYSVVAEIYDAQHRLVGQAKGLKGEISINNPNLWWPRGMNESVGYLYTLKIQLWNDAKNVEGDVYRLPFGIRFIEWNSTGVYINGKSVYFKGFGRHEDAILRGRGLDLVTLTKDYNLMRWIEANAFRTSHYPYSEELMDLADQQGFLVIDEVPAVGLDNFDDELLEAHMQTLKELVQRDKNRPAVVVWSIGNEPQSQKQVSAHYFERVANYTRSLDLARPVTMVLAQSYASDLAAQFLDVICINRYFGWYSDTGHSELITYQMIKEVTAWHDKHLKPVLVTEYGAGALAGLHTDPPVVWTEDYQVVLMEQNFKAFDQLRQMGFLIGEMIWNFADFATPQEYFRPTGCMKGVFTRERQPKFAAHFLRRRYAQLT